MLKLNHNVLRLPFFLKIRTNRLLLLYMYSNYFEAETVSRSQPEYPGVIHTVKENISTDPKANYNESKLMNALFARYVGWHFNILLR